MTGTRAALQRLATFYETLTPHSVARLADVYAADARFKDPFNDVRGHAPIIRIFEHMFVQLLEPRFVWRSTAITGTPPRSCTKNCPSSAP